MKKNKKFIIVFIFLFIMCSIFYSTNALGWDGATQAKGFVTSSPTSDGGITSSTKTVVKTIITIVRTIATGVAVIMLIAVGIKYMMSAPGDRADIKKHAVIYVVGAVVLFASSALVTIIAKFAGAIS